MQRRGERGELNLPLAFPHTHTQLTQDASQTLTLDLPPLDMVFEHTHTHTTQACAHTHTHTSPHTIHKRTHINIRIPTHTHIRTQLTQEASQTLTLDLPPLDMDFESCAAVDVNTAEVTGSKIEQMLLESKLRLMYPHIKFGCVFLEVDTFLGNFVCPPANLRISKCTVFLQ